jgi:hypothetical protein
VTFFQTIFLISVLPYFLVPLLFSATLPPNTEQVKQAILFLANAHIAITLYFYWDHGFVNIIRSNRTRYFVAPAVAVLGSGISYAAVPASYEFVWWSIYMLWNNWHFGRQTYGVYALVVRDQTPDKKVSRIERSLIYCTIAAGAAGVLFLVVGNTGRRYELALQTRTVCGYVTLLALGLGLAYLASNRSVFNLRRALFFLYALLFFVPQYINSTAQIGYTSYSVSHSLQYLFVMAVVAFSGAGSLPNRSQLPPNLWATVLFASIILIGGAIITIRGEFGTLLFNLTGSTTLARFVTGAMFGLVVAHYVVDAHAWRLREKAQREFVLDRFHFLGVPERASTAASAS